MLTPRFDISQTDLEVIFNVYAPFADISKTEVHVEGKTFIFYSPPAPYYLRLQLPGEIEESSSSHGIYNADSATFIITVSKVNKGEYFPDLDLITSLLLIPRKRVNVSPGVQVVGGSTNGASSGEEEPDDFEWFAEPQHIDNAPSIGIVLGGTKYGFGNLKSGVFQNLQCVVLELLDLLEPDTTLASDRSALKIQQEHVDFSEEHYVADFIEFDEISEFIMFQAPWQGDACPWQEMKLSGAELDIMKELQNRDYLLDKEVQQQVYLGLVDIIAAYCYNYRTTLGEDTSESAWTINKLSSTLSWLQCFSTVQEVAEAFVRRVLCYPLYRHWNLALQTLQDVQLILRLGKKQLLKCLLDIHSLFNSSEPRYILNQLYIDDYCVWIQKASQQQLLSLAEALSKVSLKKSAMDLDIPELESAAIIVRDEEKAMQDVDAVADTLGGLSLGNQHGVAQENDSDDDGDSSSDSSTESDTSSTTSSVSSALDSDDTSSGSSGS